jgi:hypothetical protein
MEDISGPCSQNKVRLIHAYQAFELTWMDAKEARPTLDVDKDMLERRLNYGIVRIRVACHPPQVGMLASFHGA